MALELTTLQAELVVIQVTGVRIQQRLSSLLDEYNKEPFMKIRPKHQVARRMTKSGARDATRRGYELFGEYFPFNNAQETMVAVLTTFAELDSDFSEKLARDIRPTIKRRPFVARSRSALYPDSPHLVSASREFAPGWWIATNESNERKIRLLRHACKVLHLNYGSDLRVWF